MLRTTNMEIADRDERHERSSDSKERRNWGARHVVPSTRAKAFLHRPSHNSQPRRRRRCGPGRVLEGIPPPPKLRRQIDLFHLVDAHRHQFRTNDPSEEAQFLRSYASERQRKRIVVGSDGLRAKSGAGILGTRTIETASWRNCGASSQHSPCSGDAHVTGSFRRRNGSRDRRFGPGGEGTASPRQGRAAQIESSAQHQRSPLARQLSKEHLRRRL